MNNIFKICFLLLILTSCSKKKHVSGYLYSKNNTLVSGAKINLVTNSNSKYAENVSHVATTDGNGYYSFSFKAKNNRVYTVNCIGDSGNVASGRVPAGKINVIDLKFP
jgi:hypothetical protein